MSKRVSVRLSDEQYESLMQEAARRGITVSDVIRFRLDDGGATLDGDTLLKKWDWEQRKRCFVYLSDKERETLSNNARRFGLTNSAYVRSRCIYRPGTYVEVDRGLLGDCFRQLRNQGVNLNQIAREINSAARVARAADAVSRLRPEIEKCLHEIYEATQRYIHIMSGVEHNGYR